MSVVPDTICDVRHSDSTVKTYRYLRLAVLSLAVFLGASLVVEIFFGTTVWLGSISAYYYTSVRSVFVGTLVAMGVCLVALKGRDEGGEDVMLNLAGVCAPVVALVPTPVASNLCHLGGPCVPATYVAGVDNNVVALLAVGFLGVVVGVASYAAHRRPRRRADLLGVAFGVVAWLVLLVWFTAFRSSFLDYAHYVSAVTMFGFIVAVAAVNAARVDSFVAAGGSLSMLSARQFRLGYRVVAAVMVATILVAVVLALTDPWLHWVFVVETVLLVAFSAFWVLQTMQFWKDGAPS
jgi:hypothetical protein